MKNWINGQLKYARQMISYQTNSLSENSSKYTQFCLRAILKWTKSKKYDGDNVQLWAK